MTVSSQGEGDLERHRDMEVRGLCEDEDNNWSDAAIVEEHQGLLAITIHQEEARKNSSLQPSQRTWSCRHLDFRLLVSSTLQEEISAVLSYPACGNLLRKPYETNPGVKYWEIDVVLCQVLQIAITGMHTYAFVFFSNIHLGRRMRRRGTRCVICSFIKIST